VKKKIAEVTPGMVRKVARDFFRPENICLALVSPLKSDRGLRKLLQF
jgi:predicted Zn-dependent peptidase